MAAGLGFKTFTTGEVLTAADTNGYLMQGVLVFASAAARDAAITSPQEGQFAYTKDTNGLWYYDGAAWVASGATGDIEGVTAGVGISGGGTSGTVTITNDMATTITASGDIVVGTGSGTYDNLPIGTTNQVLTADTTVSPYKVKWATPAAGGTTFSGSAVYDSAGSQSLTNNTWTTLTFNSEFYDTDAYHSTATNTGRFTIPAGKTGYYQINAQTVFEANVTGFRLVRVLKNGATTIGTSGDNASVSGTMYPQAICIMSFYLTAGDYIEMQAIQSSGGSLYCFKDGKNGCYQINYLGA